MNKPNPKNEAFEFSPFRDSRREEMYRQFMAFHEEHPEVWHLFVEYTLDRIRKGFKHYSASAIFERVRWETPIGADGTLEFKLNNNHRAFYSRGFERVYPEHAGFFRKRTQKSDFRPATLLPPLGPKDYPETNT